MISGRLSLHSTYAPFGCLRRYTGQEGRKRRAHCLAKCLNVARRPGCFPKISTQLPGNCGGITLKPIHWWESSTAQSCSASLGANVDEPPDRNIERHSGV